MKIPEENKEEMKQLINGILGKIEGRIFERIDAGEIVGTPGDELLSLILDFKQFEMQAIERAYRKEGTEKKADEKKKEVMGPFPENVVQFKGKE